MASASRRAASRSPRARWRAKEIQVEIRPSGLASEPLLVEAQSPLQVGRRRGGQSGGTRRCADRSRRRLDLAAGREDRRDLAEHAVEPLRALAARGDGVRPAETPKPEPAEPAAADGRVLDQRGQLVETDAMEANRELAQRVRGQRVLEHGVEERRP